MDCIIMLTHDYSCACGFGGAKLEQGKTRRGGKSWGSPGSGLDEDLVREYIRKQEQEDRRMEHSNWLRSSRLWAANASKLL